MTHLGENSVFGMACLPNQIKFYLRTDGEEIMVQGAQPWELRREVEMLVLASVLLLPPSGGLLLLI
jgi:hypothetical protein